MSQASDDDLRSHFRALRDHDAAHAPEFHALSRHAARRIGRRMRPSAAVFLWIAAASVVAAAGVVLQQSRRDDDTPDFARNAAPTISNWSSPTDGLLRTPGRELLSPPPILSSILDGATGALVNSKGD